MQDLENDKSSLILDLKVKIQSTDLLIQAPVQNGYAKLNLRKGQEKRITIVQMPIALLTIGKSVQLTVNGITVSATRINKETNDIQNYSVCFLQYVFLIWNFMDAIKEGDIFRTNVCFKTMIPLFYCHSELSKYLAECIDYIQKTEILLSTKMSMKVRAASFINKSGRIGKNKPADMEKENQVKLLKELIRGLGSNKTENAIVGISKAAPVIESVVHHFDEEAGICEIRTTHKSRSLERDSNQGRSLQSYKGINANPIYSVNKEKFHQVVLRTAQRLRRGQISDQTEEYTSNIEGGDSDSDDPGSLFE